MASNYPELNWVYETESGVILSVGAGATIRIRAAGSDSDAAESPLTTDGDGRTAAGTFAAIATGTVVHFRLENFQGMASSVAIVAT